ncbi:MAG TPA: hypothetical protein VHD15_01085 [Hyphomicrobiales bacterium]|nr:hypothetical protein [Hyphomicrobiales bacterium]
MIAAAGTCLRIALGGLVLVCAALYALNVYAGGLACAVTPDARVLDSIMTAERSLVGAFRSLP